MTPLYNQESVPALLHCDGVQSRYIESSRLTPIDMSVIPGTVTWLCGANGAGKTTLLSMLAGLVTPDRGHVQTPCAFSYVSAAHGLKEGATVGQYLACMGEKKRTHIQATRQPGDVDTAQAPDGAWFQNIRDLPPTRRIDTLSSGQKMALRLVGVMAQQRPLWLLDEPTRFLDAAREAELWHALSLHCQRGGAAVIATHAVPMLDVPHETVWL
jgi:ABC-type multidrug transport system ATPase subunit